MGIDDYMIKPIDLDELFLRIGALLRRAKIASSRQLTVGSFTMFCTMVWGDSMFIPGIIVGVIGIALVSAANPLYRYITKKEREKIAPEVICLTDELMK